MLDGAAEADPVQGAERQQQGTALSEADHLAGHPAAVAGQNPAAGADRQKPLQAGNLDGQPQNAGHAAEMPVGRQAVEAL